MTVRKILGATALIVASQAQAGFVDFTFNGPNDARLGDIDNNSHTEFAGGYSVDIMPYMKGPTGGWESFMGGNNNNDADDMRISRMTPIGADPLTNGALGVNRPNAYPDNNQIDSIGSFRDGLWFDFGNTKWSSLIITLREWNTPDAFNVWMGDSWSPTSADSPLEHVAAGTRSGQTYTIADFGHQYLFFAVAADSFNGTGTELGCRTNATNIVQTTRANCVLIDNIRAVPEPASIALLSLGLFVGFGTKPRRLLKEKM